MKTYNLRTDEGSIEIEFRPGEWAQACAFFTTKWTYPDLEGNNKALAIATEGLPAHIVLCVNSHDSLLAACEEALTDYVGCRVERFTDYERAKMERLQSAVQKAKSL